MEKVPTESNPSRARPTAEEPVKSIETDGKDDGSERDQDKAEADPSTITNEQWRSMMDVVINIYEYREEE